MNELKLHPSDTLIGLLERFSPSGNEKQAAEWLVSHMAKIGFSHSFIDGAENPVGVMGTGPRQIVLLGHIDTVTGEIPLRKNGNLIYARGSVDAKGPLAAFVDAVTLVGALDGWQLVVIGAVEEERDSIGARYIQTRYQPEYAIIGEPSSWNRVTLGYKGTAWAEIETCRPRLHTAAQEASACEIAVTGWQAVQDYVNQYNLGKRRVFDRIQATLRGFTSLEDGFEEHATLRVGARLPPGYAPEDWYARLSQLLPEDRITPQGFPIPAYEGGKNNPLVRAFLSGIRLAQGNPGFVVKSGTADLNLVAPAWGCPAVAYGPGDSTLDHTQEEHIDLQEYMKAVDILASVLQKLTSV